jgi:hypothetical protein
MLKNEETKYGNIFEKKKKKKYVLFIEKKDH